MSPSFAWEIETGRAVRWETRWDVLGDCGREYVVTNVTQEGFLLAGWHNHPIKAPTYYGRGATPEEAWGRFLAWFVASRLLGDV